jgi:Arc/MetJ-type ribon-helix-helix transcriptional regulator
MSTKPTSVVLPDELRTGLKLVFERDGVPQSEQIRRACRAWLEERRALAPKKAARNVKKRR